MIPNATINYKEQDCIPTQEPEFQKVIYALREQIGIARECAQVVNYVGNNLMPICNLADPGSDKEKSRPGIIGILWEEINNLKQINTLNVQTYEHLKSIIGS